tara:strand:- start:1221 stop:1514 length:294 start_codon:yes stop_codon:yes gene_type:complete
MLRHDGESTSDPEIQAALARRSRLRWTYSVLLIGVYLAWAVTGVYLPAFYASPFLGLALPTGIAMAFAIIGLSILLAAIYVRKVDRFEDDEKRARSR